MTPIIPIRKSGVLKIMGSAKECIRPFPMNFKRLPLERGSIRIWNPCKPIWMRIWMSTMKKEPAKENAARKELSRIRFEMELSSLERKI
jgi:hypothetical protein